MYINPYQNLSGGRWIKANFHTHAGTGPKTCGKNPIGRVVSLYRENGYGILCISNHDRYTDTDAWTDKKLLMVPGVEYTTPDDSHMLTIGVRQSLYPLGHQAAIDRTREAGGFVILCHPNWIRKEYWSWDRLDKLTGYAGLEVVNMLICRLQGSGIAADTWDHLLTGGRLVWGFGNDDFHILSDAARSFTAVYCDGRSFEGVMKAVEGGALCASTGLLPAYLTLCGEEICVKAAFPVETYVDTFTYRFVGPGGTLLSEQKGSEGRYALRGEDYVRVEAVGENGAMLFFQPVYREGALTKK